MAAAEQYQIEELVPHSGTMSLLTRVVSHGEDWLAVEVDIHKDTVFAEEQGVPSWVGLEYMAQAIAAYAGLEQRVIGGEPKLGFLLGTRRYNVDKEWFPLGETLSIKVTCEMVAENGLHVFDAVLASSQVQASASLNVFQPEDAQAFLKESKE